jgi:hypothetical protein
VINSADPIETPAQLRATEIARNLQRITDQLTTPHRDPLRLHRQLLHAQRDVVATLIDLNAIIGGPAPLPSAGDDPGAPGDHSRRSQRGGTSTDRSGAGQLTSEQSRSDRREMGEQSAASRRTPSVSSAAVAEQ